MEKTHKILIVEDSAVAAMAAKSVLKAKGCDAVIAKSGEEAISMLDDTFTLVLMDIGLPGMDGFETSRKIRAGNILPQIPIVALTAHEGGEEKLKLAKEIGMNGFLSKPFIPELCDAFLMHFNDLETAKIFFQITDREG